MLAWWNGGMLILKGFFQPSKTSIPAFHLRGKRAKVKKVIRWADGSILKLPASTISVEPTRQVCSTSELKWVMDTQ